MYKDKLRELKRVSRALFKRLSEFGKRPKLLANLASSLNISEDFLARMKNLSADVQIFTEVEMTTLEKLITETKVTDWGRVLERGGGGGKVTDWGRGGGWQGD